MANKIQAGNLTNRGRGRPKGAVNKVTAAAKDMIAQAAADLGGFERMVQWAQEDQKNEAAFWTTIYPKLIPVQLSGDPDNPLVHRIEEMRRVVVDPRNSDS